MATPGLSASTGVYGSKEYHLGHIRQCYRYQISRNTSIFRVQSLPKLLLLPTHEPVRNQLVLNGARNGSLVRTDVQPATTDDW